MITHWSHSDNFILIKEDTMNTYITLMKLTDQGVKTLKEAPKRIEANLKAVEGAGGKMIGFYLTLGEYDYIAIAEGPSDEVATSFNLALSAQGNVRTTTLKAFTLEEFTSMVNKMP
jgi:uncharacterized protein with GYD domain